MKKIDTFSDYGTAEQFRDEILQCLIQESTLVKGETYEEKYKSAEKYLMDVFQKANASYAVPTYRKLLSVMKILVGNEFKAGKDSKIISKNFMKISNKIKKACV